MAGNNFTPKQWMLVRDNEEERWALAQYSHYNENATFEHRMLLNVGFRYCIPFDGNEHLLGTTDDYVEPYVPKDGDFIHVDDEEYDLHRTAIFSYIDDYGQIHSYADEQVNYAEKNYYIASCKVRPATDSEKQQLLSKLAEIGKKWNAEKKCIEDVWTPKDGDFVTFEAYVSKIKFTAICNSCSNYIMHYYVGTIGRERDVIHLHSAYSLDSRDVVKPATDSEKQQLLDALHKNGKDWDESKKEIVEYRWKPKQNKDYWFINSLGVVSKTYWSEGADSDTQRYTLGNCFRTREEAQAMADEFKELLKGGKG